MANVHDYLRWRGDLTFAERPFNDVDNIVLSALVYLDFTGVVPDELQGGSVRLCDACRQLIEAGGGDVTPYVRSLAHIDTPLIELIAQSQRFCDARLRSFVDVMDEHRTEQFCAVEVILPDAGVYVAFRGTDSTLVGWRENFMLSFEVTEAQREAAVYLRRALKRAAFDNLTVRVGGHSKGGNLAEYAVLSCTPEEAERVTHVYSNDGPGMAPEVIPQDGRAILGDKLRRIIPTYSLVGMLFAKETDPCIVVASNSTGIGQHDLTTWQVLPDGMEEVEGLQPESLVIHEAATKWIANVPLEERERIVNELFDALESGGATRFDEIAATPEGLQQVIRSLRNVDERTRDVALALVQGTVDTSVDAVRKAARKVIEDATHRLFGTPEE